MTLHDVFYANKTIYLVMEYLETDLSKLIKDNSVILKEEHIKNIMIQLLEGVTYLHQNFIMHRVRSLAVLIILPIGSCT